jgi:hypothetical protein
MPAASRPAIPRVTAATGAPEAVLVPAAPRRALPATGGRPVIPARLASAPAVLSAVAALLAAAMTIPWPGVPALLPRVIALPVGMLPTRGLLARVSPAPLSARVPIPVGPGATGVFA